jgi:site-specific recombinase XerD
MCKVVRDLLLRIKRERGDFSNFVFAHADGGSCRLSLLDMLKIAQEKANIRGRLRIHDLRHSFAATLRRLGVPLEVIMGLMRHSDLSETLIYAPYEISEGRKAVQVLNKV